MKWVYVCVSMLAICLLYFRPYFRRSPANDYVKWTLRKPNFTLETHRFENCTWSTCLRSHHCMLNYTSLSVYIQPLLTVVDENDNVLTPFPSREFLAIRSSLKSYAVSDPQQACIFFPGVDFLNLYRFPSIEVAHAVAAMLGDRFYNVLIFTLIGQWRHALRQIVASSVTSRHTYRHRLDISLPPFPGFLSPRKEIAVVRYGLLVLAVNASASYKEDCLKEFNGLESATVLTDCLDSPWFACDAAGNKIDWLKALQGSKFVLIHEEMPLFKTALFKAMEFSVIPIIFMPKYVLPFSDYIDWNLFSLQPSSLSQVRVVINAIDDARAQTMRNQMINVFLDFSSLERIVAMTWRVLEARMLPLKARKYEYWNKLTDKAFTLPHFEPATKLMLLAHCDMQSAKYIVELIRHLESSDLLSTATIIWRDEESSPSKEMWESSLPVEIITGAKKLRDLIPLVKRSKIDAMLIVPIWCHLDMGVVRKALNIWRSVPNRYITLPCSSAEFSANFVHKMLFTSILSHSHRDADLDTALDLLNESGSGIVLVTRDQLDAAVFVVNVDGSQCVADTNSSSRCKMRASQSTLNAVGVIYFLFIAIFFHQSNGFVKFYNAMYPVWKVIPIVFLGLFAAIDGGGLPPNKRAALTLGLLFGGIGDVLIGSSKEGLVPGGVAFAVGHLFYMSFFISRPLKIYWPLLYLVAAWAAILGTVVYLLRDPFDVFVGSIYSIILKTCVVTTASHYVHRDAGDKDEGLYLRFLGYMLFYVSDSVLIWDDTAFKLPLAELIILSTYYAAQYLILCGNIHTGLYVKSKET